MEESLYNRFGKRAVDALLSAVGLLVLLPVLAGLAVTVWITMGSPVLFRQQRPGLGGGPFELLKFRSMKTSTDTDGRPQADSQRLTKTGALLRSTSLDELPTLFNVLRGDMSMVGPRPLLMEYLPRYSKEQGRRHHVRPGITGLAQISGRNALTWERRFELDVQYVETMSPLLDLKILLRTVWLVLARSGISQPGHVTAEKFKGVR